MRPFRVGAVLQYAATASVRKWTPIHAEDYGFVDLNRALAADEQPAGIVRLRTQVVSDRSQAKHLSLGWIGQVWVFVNGKQITTGTNFYYPEGERREPDGRLSLQNGSFDVPLQKGSNEIGVAIFNSIRDQPTTTTRYGWGLKMRFSNLAGIRLLP